MTDCVLTVMGNPPLKWSRDQVAARILAGESLVIHNNQLLRIPKSWLDAHPGGSLAILHFVGRDASDEIQAYHCDETMKKINRYSIGTVETTSYAWDPLVPPVMTGWVRKLGKEGQQEWHNEAGILFNSEGATELSPSSQILLVQKDDALLKPSAPTMAHLLPPPTNLSLKVQAEHSAAYKALHQRIIDGGFYQTRYLTGYGPEILRYLTLAWLSYFAYQHNWFITSAVFLGMVWHQLVFTVHDLGHMGVTHNWVWDRLMAILIADFVGGLSVGWWVDVSPQIIYSRCA